MVIAFLFAAALTLDPPFTDHAVLQRDKPVVVRGSADAGAAVSVSFAGNTVKGVADAAGRWSVKLPAMPASKEPRDLTVTSQTSQTSQTSRTSISDVLVGEVWLASGQSNMEMPLWHPKRKRFRDKMGGLMRQFPPPANLRVMMTWPERGVSATPRRDYPVAWTVPDEAWLSTNKFSACAYYFGRELMTTLDVPVGVMAAFWGGTEIGSWVPDSGWESVKSEPYVATNILERVSKRVALESEGKRRGWPGYPGDLWNEQVAVFAPYTVRGMIWYQGESNIDENFSGRLAYSKNMRALMDGWRREFGCPDMKLLFVELAPFFYPWLKLPPDDDRLARLCDEQQRFAVEEPNAHLACISDVGDVNDIHPCRKWEVGTRLAALAFQHVYGLPVRADPPRAVSARLVAPGKVEISLKNAQGLYRWMPEVSLWTTNQHEVSPIRFIGRDGRIVDCESTITNDMIVAESAQLKNPAEVTYLRRCADEGNIYNDSALPLGTFSLPVKERLRDNTVRFEDLGGVFAEMELPDPAVIDLKVERMGAFAVLTVAPAAGAAREVREIELPEIRLVREIPNARTLGSGGLKRLGEDVGSYTFLAVAEPRTRKGVVAAFLTGRKGSGVIFSENRGGRAILKPVIQYGRMRLDSGESCAGEKLLIGGFNDCRDGLERYADFVADYYGVKLPQQISGYCTWYSDKFGAAGTERSTEEFAAVAARKLGPWGLSFFQVDDQWQGGMVTNCLRRDFRTVRADGPYPSGLAKTAANLRAKGIRTGLWFLPFCGSQGDPVFADKKDIFVRSRLTTQRSRERDAKSRDGVDWLYPEMDNDANAPYECFWGGTVIDYTNPKSGNYLRDLVRRFRDEWGVSYLKFDARFGAVATLHMYPCDEYRADDLGEQIFHDPKATNMENARKALETLRAVAGKDMFLLGCNLSQSMRTMVSAYGIVDAMRVGPDNSSKWDGIKAGPVRGTSRYFLNGRVWYNDPDPVYVRNTIPSSHARVSATWASMSGDLFAFSDWLPDLSDERVNILRRTIAPHRRSTKVRPVDIFESDLANTWLLADGDSRIFGFFNWDEKKPLAVNYEAKYAGLDPEKSYVGFDFWENRFVAPFRGKVEAEVGAGDAKVWQLREFDGTRPVLVSTSRHSASPLFEVTDEKWDASARTLSGSSEVVAGDLYELRLVLPEGMAVATAEIGGNAAEVKTEKCNVRIRTNPNKSKVENWQVRFRVLSL